MRVIYALILASTVLFAAERGEAVAVRQTEGEVHGFLVLRTLSGAHVANCELGQTPRANDVTTRLTCHFKDGSLQDETTVFSQSGHFKILSEHLVQKGPAFKHPMDVEINGSTGQVIVHYSDDGKEKTASEQLEVPPDLANGMVPTFLKNMEPGAQSRRLSMIVATPKPMLVGLDITAEGEDAFTAGTAGHKATRYVVKVDIPGIKGVVAPIVGKQPPNTHVWIYGGSSPAFVRSEGPFFEGGPIWRMELVSPSWPKTPSPSGKGSATRKK